MSAGCPEDQGWPCERACGARWCVLKAQRLVAEQAAAEAGVRLAPAPAPVADDVALAVAIHGRIAEDLAAAVEAKAVHADGLPWRPPAMRCQTRPLSALTGTENAKTVDGGPLLRLGPGLADAIRRERVIAGPLAEAKAVHVDVPVDAVPDPLPLPPVPATNPIRVAAPPVPGMRFTWQLDEPTRPIPRQEP